MITTNKIQTPLGEMIAGVLNGELCLLEFNRPDRILFQLAHLYKIFNVEIQEGSDPLLDEISKQLSAYFDGKLTSFSLPLNVEGSNFQMEVWQLLMEVEYGTTCSYMELAIAAGDHKKVRAVGRANGENRIAIVVPCHRVIGADGALVGYAGELWRKKELLDLERKTSGKPIQMGFDF